MKLALALSIFSIILAISYIFSVDYAGTIAFLSLGISLALMEDVGTDRLLMLSGDSMLSVKAIFAWVTLIGFIILFSYKVIRDTRQSM
ncbi:hypothetical protein ACP6PL_09255 [Dapis sp. BLCC M126]|uniref:hypothetical protein n=1 Tax=Dapis sp. BLCC M126 TaxID=3400189 RepID=UPI003CEF0DBB